MTLGAEVRRLRVAGGLTQRELAEPAYTRAFVAAIESGARIPSDEALAHIAARLGVDADDLRHARPSGAAETLTARLAAARRAMSHGRYEAASAEFAAVRVEAEAYRLPDVAAWAGYFLGDVLLHQGEVAAASAAYEAVDAGLPEDVLSAPGGADRLADPDAVKLRAGVTSRLGYTWFTVGDTHRALALLEGRFRALRSAPDQYPDAHIRIASMLMYVYNELDWNERARRLERESLPLLRLAADVEWVGQFASMAAQLRRAESELDDVERFLAEAQRCFLASGLKREIGVCHWARGYVLRRADRLAEAAESFRQARAVMSEVGAVQDVAGVTVELAEVLRRQGVLDEAADLAAEAARTSAHTGHEEGRAEAERLLGLVAGQRGEDAEAERWLVAAADRYEAAGLMAELVTTCGLLGELLLHLGRGAEAATVLRRGLRGAETLR